MLARQLLIVDDNRISRKNLQLLFEETHYDVDTTASAAYAIAKIVQGNAPIVILGDSFEETISVADVVALMRRCNSHLNIILISDNSSLELLRKMREDGIFYHALPPSSIEDYNELLEVVHSAVTC